MWFKKFFEIFRPTLRKDVSPDLDFCMLNRGTLTRREHFWLSKQRRFKMRDFYYQYGQLVLIHSVMDDYVVQFEYLWRGVRLEDIPTECAGVTVRLVVMR